MSIGIDSSLFEIFALSKLEVFYYHKEDLVRNLYTNSLMYWRSQAFSRKSWSGKKPLGANSCFVFYESYSDKALEIPHFTKYLKNLHSELPFWKHAQNPNCHLQEQLFYRC